MAPTPILFVIHTVTIATMLNFNGGNNGRGLKKCYGETDLYEIGLKRLLD